MDGPARDGSRTAAAPPGDLARRQRIPGSLYAVTVAQYAIGGAFLPFITLYFRDRGLSYSELGWVYLVSSASTSTLPFAWGWLADRVVPLEKLLVVLHAAGAAALLLLSFQTAFFSCLALFGIAAGILLPAGSLLNALSYHHIAKPERDFARLRAWGSVGWMAPSLPIYLWLAWGRSFDLAFTVRLSAAIQIATAALCACLPRTPPAAARLEDRGERSSYREGLRRLLARRGFGRFLAIVFLTHGSFGIFFYYSAPLLEASGFDRRWIGPLQSIGVAVEVGACFLIPRFVERLGYGLTISIGCGALFVRQVLYAWSDSAALLAASYVLSGICVVFYMVAGSMALDAMAEKEVRATAQSVFAVFGQGLGQMASHQAAGAIAGDPALGLRAVFAFAAAAAGAATAIALTLARPGTFRRWRAAEARPAAGRGRSPAPTSPDESRGRATGG